MPIASHSLATMAAVTLGGTQLFTAKGTTRHRGLGWAWVGLVTYVTTSSFFISGLKHWGRVQLDTFTSIWGFSLVMAVCQARQGNIRQHKNWMRLVTSLRYWSRECFTMAGRAMLAYCWAFSTV